MKNDADQEVRAKHLTITEPSPWVRRFASLVPKSGPAGGLVLDLAAGGGRHARHFLGLGHAVVALDKTVDAMADLAKEKNVEVIPFDLEAGVSAFSGKGPLAGRKFDGICVVNYLHRPLMADIVGALTPGGVLIYETFARGQERFVRPRNPDHLLKAGELLDLVRGRLQVVAYEHGLIEADDIPGVKQRLVAVNDLGASTRDDGEPEPHTVPVND